MTSTFWYGFLAAYHADIIQEFMPETGIKQVQSSVLHTTIIPVNRQPVIQRFFCCQGIDIVWDHNNGGNTRKNQPTVAWYRFHVLQVFHKLDRLYSQIPEGLPVGIPHLESVHKILLQAISKAIGLLGLEQHHNVHSEQLELVPPITLTGKYPVTQLKVYFWFRLFRFLLTSPQFSL